MQGAALHPGHANVQVVGQPGRGGPIAADAAQGLQPLPELIAQGPEPLLPL